MCCRVVHTASSVCTRRCADLSPCPGSTSRRVHRGSCWLCWMIRAGRSSTSCTSCRRCRSCKQRIGWVHRGLLFGVNQQPATLSCVNVSCPHKHRACTQAHWQQLLVCRRSNLMCLIPLTSQHLDRLASLSTTCAAALQAQVDTTQPLIDRLEVFACANQSTAEELQQAGAGGAGTPSDQLVRVVLWCACSRTHLSAAAAACFCLLCVYLLVWLDALAPPCKHTHGPLAHPSIQVSCTSCCCTTITHPIAAHACVLCRQQRRLHWPN